ncbi:hypothetical protein QBC42DRAFT_193632 [Cladorrhinum samala]|uniref:Uncharacterized protein n=1 Tax=Cladorrhinum samala TaxID=585594 RepID=A0AAV9I3N2_9PEZI|nr:hypothetical protein QBC42DRAFT_193632 [Cladorrhinum samala]
MSYKTPTSEPIAIVGTACRFAGGATSPSRLWDVLANPTDLTQAIPKDRFNIDAFYHEDGEYHGTTNSPKAYFLEQDHRVFDASFFNIAPREAEAIDPQQRMLLEVVYEALESAGFTIQQHAGTKVGVFAGLMTGDYDTLSQRDELHTSQYYATGNARSILSNRLSYFFDFRGPSMTIDTACSSSLVALHQAVLSLRSGECDMACVAGANLILTPEQFIVESNLHMLSPSGHCRHFDAECDGYARGEGIAAMFIRPLSKALANGDHIISVIRETATNSDGRSKGITMPNWEAQSALIQDTYSRTGLDIQSVQDRCQYFECHGTGTAAGDPNEAHAIHDAFFGRNATTETDDQPTKEVSGKTPVLHVGSVKTVIGHTEGAAGLAGVLKVIESMRHNKIPPNMHLDTLNPNVAKFYGHLLVSTSLHPWPAVPEGQPKRASVNSFGFGGSNAHVIVEEYTPELHNAAAESFNPSLKAASVATEVDRPSQNIQVCLPLLLSAASPATLLRIVVNYRDYLSRNSTSSIQNVAWHTARLTSFPYRVAVASTSTSGLINELNILINKANKSSSLAIGDRARSKAGQMKILGIFTGQGAQWATMSRGLLLSSQTFATTIHSLDKILQTCSDPPSWTLEQEIMAEKGLSRVQTPSISQPLCTAIQIALVDLLRNLGITFHTVVGHSSGEIAAAYAAGRISARDAILISHYRGLSVRLASKSRAAKGGMMAVGLSRKEAAELCAQKEYSQAICVAASNSPESVTISGDLDIINDAADYLTSKHTFARVLQVDAAYHSPHMEAPAAEYLEKMRACNILPSAEGNGINWVSSVHGAGKAGNSELTALYWKNNMVSPVLFYEAMKDALQQFGPFDCAIEVGPHAQLKSAVLATMEEVGAAIPYSGLLDRRMDDRVAFASFLGWMWAELGAPNSQIRQFVRASMQPDIVDSRIIDAPSYPWDHSQIHWRESRISREYHFKTEKPHELLGVRTRDDDKHQMRWRNILRPEKLPWTRHHSFQGQPLLPASAYLIMALDAAQVAAAGKPACLVEIRDLRFPSGITLEPDTPGVECLFSLTIEQESQEKIEASVMLSSTIADGRTDMKKNFTGKITIFLGKPSADVLPFRAKHRAETLNASPDAFYRMMVGTGLDYTGPFQGLQELQRRYNFSSATLRKYHPEDTTNLRISPATLDSCLQTAFVTISSPGDNAIWTSFLPLEIDCVRFNVAICDIKDRNDMLAVDAYMTRATPFARQAPASFTADIEIFDPKGQLEIQIEGLTVGSFSSTKPEDDYELYLTTQLDVDPDDEIVGTSLEEIHAHSPMLIESCQRVASFYANATSSTKLCEGPQKFLTSGAGNSNVQLDKTAWSGQTEETLDQFIRTSPYSASLAFVRRLGKNMPDVLGGMLPTIVEEAHQLLGFQRHISRVIRQIAHKYPRMNVLGLTDPELGLSEHILSGLGEAFLSYRVGAQPEKDLNDRTHLTNALRKKIMVDALDLETDTTNDLGLYDLAVVTTSLFEDQKAGAVLRRICGMMRPGGFLMLLNVSRNPLRDRMRSAADAGPKQRMPITPPDWPDVLDQCGFVCTVRNSHQFYPPGFSLIVRQVESKEKEMLQRPLQHLQESPLTEHILVVGGKKLWTSLISSAVSKALLPYCGHITSIETLDELNPIGASSVTAALFLNDLDEGALATMTEKRMDILKLLLRPEMKVLWVTLGARFHNPDHAATFGFTRTMAAEIPGLAIQTLDLDTIDTAPAVDAITETLARLLVRSVIHSTTEDSNPLWITEPEVHFEDGRRLVPRVLPWKEGNARVNAPRRVMSEMVNTVEKMVRIVATGSVNGRYSTEVAKCDPTHRAPSDAPTLQVEYSTVDALNLGFGLWGHVCIGRDTQSFATQVALSTSNASYIVTPSTCVSNLGSSPAVIDQPLFVGLLVRYLFAITVANKVQEKPFPLTEPAVIANMVHRPVLLVEPDEMLHQCVGDIFDKRGVLYTVCTTDEARSKRTPSLVFIHSGMPTRQVQNIMPIGGGWLFDFLPKSEKLSTMLKSSLPTHCKYTHYSDWLGPMNQQASDVLDVASIWQDAVQLSLTKLKKLSSSAVEPALISVPDLLESQEPAMTFQLLNWKANRVISHIIRPLACTSALSPNKTYVLIGLTRDFGQSLCTLLVSQGARHIILASRSPPKTTPTWQTEMLSRGIFVGFEALDVTSMDRVAAFKAKLAESLPPVGGVVNGAMVLDDRVFSQMPLDSLQRVMGPKTIGSKNLDQVFSSPDMDFFIMTSSFAAIGGHAGQSNYAAANMYTNGLAASRRRRGLVGSVLNIGVIYGLGFLHREKDNLYEGLEREGYPPISERDIHHMFVEAIMAGKPVPDQIYDITTGLRRFQANNPSLPWHNDPRFSHYTRREDDSDVAVDINGSKKSLKELIDAAQDKSAVIKVLELAFIERMQTQLMLAEGAVKSHQSIVELGVDSLAAVEIRSWVWKSVGFDVPVMKLLGGITTSELCEDIATSITETRITAPKLSSSMLLSRDNSAVTSKNSSSIVDNVVPSHQRILSGSVRHPPAPWPASATTAAEQIDAKAVAKKVVDSINDALSATPKDHAAVASLFRGGSSPSDGDDNAFWRDHLGLSWELRTLKGKTKIQDFLGENLKNLVKSARGRGRGVVRLVEEEQQQGRNGGGGLGGGGGAWKIWTIFTTLEGLNGFEEPLGGLRSEGVKHGGMVGRKNWRERREEEAEFADGGSPEVLVIGAGQGGLTIAARLKMLGVSTLIVDKNERVGDNWRKRYHQLVLHDPVWYDHMPYLPFPEFWPIFTPKDKLADWFESYVKTLELNVWMESEVESSQWDADKKEWSVTLKKGPDGKRRKMNPKHVVLCTGHSGKPYMPQINGMDGFKGDVMCHSSAFAGARESGKGKKAVVVGACNSSHDICQDFYEHGYEVTMVQRSTTCVVSSKAALKVLMAVLYEQGGPPVEDSDIWLHGWPSQILKSIQVDLAKIQRDLDKDLLEGLEKAGFKTDTGIDEGGLFPKYMQRGGGYYIDVGMSQLIVDGKVKVKQGQEIVEVLPNGLKFADGTELEADEIVFATGYDTMRGTAGAILGDEVASQTEDIWGWDEEGEMRGVWKQSGHPGFWYHAGNLALTRYYSRVLALQIKGKLQGWVE